MARLIPSVMVMVVVQLQAATREQKQERRVRLVFEEQRRGEVGAQT